MCGPLEREQCDGCCQIQRLFFFFLALQASNELGKQSLDGISSANTANNIKFCAFFDSELPFKLPGKDTLRPNLIEL